VEVDEEVLEVQARLRQEGGVALEPEREASGLVARECEYDFSGGSRPEQRLAEQLLRRDALVRESLVLGQRLDAAEDDRDVGERGGT
jgi:hypothetical protein